MTNIIPLLIGIAAGIGSGIFGIGGGVVIVPMLVFALGYTQQQATAASLAAMLLPVGALGVYAYWRAGALPTAHWWAALLIALGLMLGAYAGARLALILPTEILTKAFAVFLVLVAIRIWMKAG